MNQEKFGVYTIDRRVLSDTRGWFLKVMDGNEAENSFPCEVYFTAAHPGEKKGGHYHKAANEWFTLVKGEALLEMTEVVSKGTFSLNLSANNPVTVFVPSGIAHTFINTGDQEFLLVAFTDRKYLPEDTINYTTEV
jgi:dTDP-4-dehydrorhamnose 3,5-epimerase-like enzyme